MPGRGLNPGHLHGRQLCLPHNHGVNHNELLLKMLCKHPLELLSFFGNFTEFQMLISMLLSTAIQVRPGSSALVYPNLKPHLGLYNVRACAHPKKSTFAHNLLYKLTFNYKYAVILSTYH